MQVKRLTVGLFAGAAIAAAAAPAAHAADVWDATKAPSSAGAVNAASFKAFTLDKAALRADLAGAAKGQRAAAQSGTKILAVPAPDGTMQRFAVYETSIMEAGLAARHPEIKTYAGQGLDDPSASIVADTTSLGFHASVRARQGSFYVDPYYVADDSVYASYYTRDAENDEARSFVESEPVGEAKSSSSAAAAAGPEINLRTYRLALITDPSYATYFKVAEDPNNVTAAKVTLMNRVNQIYNTESAIKMVLIADNDKLNLNTVALATGANGPCGPVQCYTATNSCGAVLNRNRYVLGQIIGADKYDIGHIAMGNSGGGVAGLGVVGLGTKATGCTGLTTPTGDYFAVDYVAHEMGHQFAGNHTFNGTQSNCGGNRAGNTSVEPGSGSSVMAYAGICAQDNLQPHSDPYWVPKSYEEILAHTTSDRTVNETQTIALNGFDGTDSLTVDVLGKTVGPFTRGTNYSAAAIQNAIQGPSEVQTVALSSYDTNGDSYRISLGGATSHPIVRGQNNTQGGILNAIRGGNETQQITLTGFNANTGTLKLQVNGVTTGVIGPGTDEALVERPYTAVAIAAAVNALPGIAGGVTSSNPGATGFTLTFGGASAQTDAPTVTVVECTCTAAVTRETAKGGAKLSTWNDNDTIAASNPADSGYTLTISGASQGTDFPGAFGVTDGSGATGTVTETVKGAPGILAPGQLGTVAGYFGGTFNDTGFEVNFGGGLAATDIPAVGLTVTGGSGFVSETNHGGAATNKGSTITPTGNHAPDVTVPASFTIPPRTPFALTGSATDPDGNALTYMWEQVDPAGIVGVTSLGTALVDQTKTNGALFRQLGVGTDIALEDSLKYNSPGLNLAGTNPTRTFPDMLQILAGNTNAATGQCPTAPATGALPTATRECFSEWLPTSLWRGFLADRGLTFRLTARDGLAAGGGLGFAETKLTVAPLAGPFQITSFGTREVIFGTLKRTLTWNTGNSELAPINAANVKVSLSTDGGLTYPLTLLDSTPNDGSAEITFPQVNAEKARIKVEALGNVFFDVSDADLALQVAPTSTPGGTVPATLSLTVGPPAQFGAFTPGLTKTYEASTTANVISTAGDALLSVADPSSTGTGHLVNGTFVLPEPLQARARNAANTGTAYNNVGSSASPLNLLTWSAPISNDAVSLQFSQLVKSTDPLRTGTYAKPLTFTLSTTTP